MQTSAHLKVTDRFGVEKKYPLAKPAFTIGRKADNDLQMLSDSVSRFHAEIVYENDAYFIVDKASKRGTLVNGQQVERCPLQHLDRIQIGGEEDLVIQFVDERMETASAIFDASQSQLSETMRARAVSANEELQKLARFVEVNQAFKFSLTPDDVLCLIVDAAIEMTKAERGFLMLKNEAGDLEFKVARDHGRNWLLGNDFAMSHTVVEEAFKHNRSVIINDSHEHSLLAARASVRNLDLRTIICIPLRRFQMSERMDATSVLKRDVIGVLYVDSHIITGALSQTSITLLESLAFEATKSLESVRLMHEEQTKQRLEREINMAREVQVALLPTGFHQPDHFEVAGHSVPCRYVGGDFYDLLPLTDGRSVFVLGDVSGKGIAAALLAAMAQGVMQAQFSGGLALADVITSLNRVIVQKSASNRFITLFCAVLDEKGNFSFVNAGHNPPILARADGRIELLATKAMVLGAFDFAEYHEHQTKLEPGDVVVIFTDGVTEAVNAAQEMFSDERLEKLVRESRVLSAEEIKDLILEDVLSFTRGLPQGDDITLIALKMK
jgi:sigma-B regulation protein RsbU (phosphoserine phosphatase)